jgi:hypothetical protein
LGIGFIDHFSTKLVSTLNYSAIANFHTLQITTADAKSFLAVSVFTGNGSNNGYFSVSMLWLLPSN